MAWDLEKPAREIAGRLWTAGSQRLPAEIMRLEDDLAAIVVDIDGIDYIMTLARVPFQRPRPASN